MKNQAYKKSGFRWIWLLSLIALPLFFGCQKADTNPAPDTPPVPEPEVEAEPVFSNLNGEELKGVLVDHPIAVIIENYTPIRNLQTGIEDAAIVYESLTEGGITRFMAVYSGGESAESIGPVRSARPYFVDWAEEYQAAFLHVGGSPAALEMLKTADVLNIDEMAGGKAIERVDTQLPPHNAFTSIENARQAIINANYDNTLLSPRFNFKDDEPTEGEISIISINFWNEPYLVKWEYDPISNTYLRYNGGERHGEIAAKNIIIQYTDQEVVDDKLRRQITTEGFGKAVVFRDGKAIDGKWEKSTDGLTQFYDLQGNRIKMNRGQTWIEVVQNTTTVNYF